MNGACAKKCTVAFGETGLPPCFIVMRFSVIKQGAVTIFGCKEIRVDIKENGAW